MAASVPLQDPLGGNLSKPIPVYILIGDHHLWGIFYEVFTAQAAAGTSGHFYIS